MIIMVSNCIDPKPRTCSGSETVVVVAIRAGFISQGSSEHSGLLQRASGAGSTRDGSVGRDGAE